MSKKRQRRPKLFVDPKKEMSRIGNAMVQETLNSTMKSIQKAKPEDVEVKKMPRYLEVTQERMNKLGVIDLKPFFAQSSKRQEKKDGKGWYLTIPIKRSARGMSRRMYDQLRAIDIDPDEKQTVISDYLYDRRKLGDAKQLNYKPVSKKIEKKKIGRNRHSYVAYRTVSNTSPASSWILHRDRVNAQDTSKTFVKNVNRLMNWKMKNGW